MRPLTPLAVFLLALSLPAFPAASAEPPAPTAREPFYESVEVEVANVEVYVTDREGRPVSGLTRGDFQLWEDGRPVEITHFLAADAADAAGADTPSPSPAVPDAGEGRTIAWFFNNLHLDPVGRIPVFPGIAKTLDTLAPTDRVVLFAYNRSSTMEMFPAFDRPAIDRALDRIRAQVPGGGRFDDVEYKKTLEALAAATTALAGLPGPKALVYITGSLPEPIDSRSPIRRYLAEAAATANANHVTLYGLGATRGAAFEATQGVTYLADRTGGLASIDPFDPSVLFSRVRTDLATYYSLGYVPSKQARASHQLKVRVERPGLEVRYRQTAKAKSGEEATRDRVMTALYLGQSANRLGIEAKLGAVQRAPKGMLKVDLEVRFPFARLALLPEDAMRKGRVRLYLASRDGQGQVSEVTEVVLPLSIPEKHLAAVLADKVTYTTQLLLRPEAGAVTIGVRDELGNVDSALVVPWSPPSV